MVDVRNFMEFPHRDHKISWGCLKFRGMGLLSINDLIGDTMINGYYLFHSEDINPHSYS